MKPPFSNSLNPPSTLIPSSGSSVVIALLHSRKEVKRISGYRRASIEGMS